MDLLTRMVEHHVWLTGEMVRLAERLTDEQLDQPIELDVDEDRQTIRSLLSRLVGQMGMWNAAVATRDYDWSVEEHESLSSLRERLAVEGPTFLGHVRDVVATGRLDDTFVDALCVPAHVFTYGGMVAHVITFAAHRRTLVALALRQPRARRARLGRPDDVGGRAGLSDSGARDTPEAARDAVHRRTGSLPLAWAGCDAPSPWASSSPWPSCARRQPSGWPSTTRRSTARTTRSTPARHRGTPRSTTPTTSPAASRSRAVPDLAARCVVVGEQRFDLAIVAGTCAALLALVGIGLAFGSRPRPAPG